MKSNTKNKSSPFRKSATTPKTTKEVFENIINEENYNIKDNQYQNMRSRQEIEKLLRNIDKFLLGESSEVSGFPFHGEKNTGNLTIMGVRFVLLWVLNNQRFYHGTGITYDNFRKGEPKIK